MTGVSRDEDAHSLLDDEVGRIAEEVGAHIVAGYLDVPSEQLIRMTVVRGVTTEIALPWSRVARTAHVPVAESVRTRRPVWAGSPQELARRFPRTALSFPYRVAMYVAPLLDDAQVCWGAVLLLWPSDRSPELSDKEERAVSASCRRAAQELRRRAEAGQSVLPRPEPFAWEPPPPSGEPAARAVDRLPEGICALDREGRLTFIDTRGCELLGRERAEILHRNLFEVIPWLQDLAFENAYLAAVFSRLPSSFQVRSTTGQFLTITMYCDDWGVTATLQSGPLPDDADTTAAPAPEMPARAGTLFHLLHLASALAEATSVQDVTDALTEQVMPVVDAQSFALLTSEEGRLKVVSSRGFPARMSEHFDGVPTTSDTAGGSVIESGVPAFHSDSATLPAAHGVERYGDLAALAFLPLPVSGRTIGCCILGYGRPRAFFPGERAELLSLAGLIAQALERARLYDVNSRAARVLQAGLLPSHLPRVSSLTAAARYRPAMKALDVGGDFYDLIRLAGDRAAAVVGDVQGHNVRAASLMGQVRTAVHTHAQVGASPADVLARTNCLLEDLNTELFVSCLYAQIDPPRQRALLVNAGHPPPILRRPDGHTEVLDLPPGLLLGVESRTSFRITEIDLPPGSLLALYTDGLVERPGTDLGTSIDDLARRVAKAPAGSLDELCDSLVRDAEETATEEISDDIALLLLRTGPHPAGGQGAPAGQFAFR